jgi:anti-anti-sigma regulatory factor
MHGILTAYGKRTMKFYLIVARGKQKGLPIPITIDLFMIGSSEMCQLRSQQPGIGVEHCALLSRERKVFIRDLNSGEATTLNGNLVPPGEECPLHAGDRIEVGPLEFMVQFREKALSQRDLEEWAARCLDVTLEQELFDEDADEFHGSTTASSAAASIIDKLQAQRGLVMGRLRIGRDQGVTTVRFNDRQLVDESEVALVKKELCHYLGKPNLRVLLDFKNIRRLSTVGVQMIGDFYTWLKPWGSTLALCRVRKDLQLILRTMDLAKIPLYDDKHEAIAERW